MSHPLFEAPEHEPLDVLIVGAGIGGLYQLHQALQANLSVACVDAASGVGGTWHWNRYPGARLDSESYSYGYMFDEELFGGWTWSEHFVTQPEVEKYVFHAVEHLGLAEHITLNFRVESAAFTQDENEWVVTAEDGRSLRARVLVTAVGLLSEPNFPPVPGRDRFRGDWAHTARWPEGGLDVAGKRVAVIGTGSTGIQVIESIAPSVGSLTVYQRTPNWVVPLNNAPITPDEMTVIQADLPGLRKRISSTHAAFVHSASETSAYDHTEQERRAYWETLWTQKGFSRNFGNYSELATDVDVNRQFSDFVAQKIRQRVRDPEVAARLIPNDHLYGGKRPPFETRYFDAFNQPNVDLVDLRDTPLVEITETGLQTTDGHRDFDVIIYATGFDAITGAYNRMNIVGVDGVRLSDAWGGGPLTYLGLGTPHFPNLLFVGGPQSLGGNIPPYLVHQADFITQLLEHMREQGHSRVAVDEAAAKDWVEEIHRVMAKSIHSTSNANSWSWGSNIAGKARTYGLYPGGLPALLERFAAVEADSFAGFTFS